MYNSKFLSKFIDGIKGCTSFSLLVFSLCFIVTIFDGTFAPMSYRFIKETAPYMQPKDFLNFLLALHDY